jgi:NDP-4-keto-2,6-dideoxyhexose 3-C-methyltransferase
MSESVYREVIACRACGGTSLETVLDLGMLCLSGFPKPEEPDPPQAPLELVLCGTCGLAQLRHTVEADRLYREFHYRSGITLTMRQALADVVDGCVAKREGVAFGPRDVVVDIGSNDGTLLAEWDADLHRVGFEPAVKLAEESIGRVPGGVIVPDYFSAPACMAATDGRKAAVITAVACFYDLDDPGGFLIDVRRCLDDRGLFVVQLADLRSMFAANDVSNVCHEHLTYYSLNTLLPLLQKHDLHPFAVEHNDVNGGSVRVYASPTERPVEPALTAALEAERRQGVDSPDAWTAFRNRAGRIKAAVGRWLQHQIQYGRTVYGYAASTKGNTLLQWWGLRRGQLAGIAERDAKKYGRQTCGTRFDIVPEADARSRADAFLVLAYAFRKEMVTREWDWLSAGKAMLFPLPLPVEVSGRILT